MSQIQKLKDDLLTARKQKNSASVKSLSTLIGEAITVGKQKEDRLPTDDEVLKVITKTIKTLQETTSLAHDAGRDHSEQDAEIALLTAYLPQQLDDAQIREYFDNLKRSNPEFKLKDAMGMIKKDHPGKYDGASASRLAREIFS